jgi:anti-sigma B factor antagonist
VDLKWPLRIVEERREGVLILALSGRLGFNSAGIVDAVVARAVGAGDTRLVIDLAGVDYLSSAGLHALAAAAGRCLSVGGALALCGLTEPARVAWDLGGLRPDLPTELSRDRAVARVRSHPPS